MTKQNGLDLVKMQDQLDKALTLETTESLNEWLKSKRLFSPEIQSLNRIKMKTQQLERANEIIKEIGKLRETMKIINNNECKPVLALQYLDKYYTKYDFKMDFGENIPTHFKFLKEQVDEDIQFIYARIVTKINKRIADFEKELELL